MDLAFSSAKFFSHKRLCLFASCSDGGVYLMPLKVHAFWPCLIRALHWLLQRQGNLLLHLHSLQHTSLDSRNRKNDRRDAKNDQLVLVMRGFCVKQQPSSDECSAGRHCPFARGPGCTIAGDASSSCPVGDACVRREWQFSPPPAWVFDVRFMNELCVMRSGNCFELVHAPRSESRIDFEPCSNVLLQGDALSFLSVCQVVLHLSACA